MAIVAVQLTLLVFIFLMALEQGAQQVGSDSDPRGAPCSSLKDNLRSCRNSEQPQPSKRRMYGAETQIVIGPALSIHTSAGGERNNPAAYNPAAYNPAASYPMQNSAGIVFFSHSPAPPALASAAYPSEAKKVHEIASGGGGGRTLPHTRPKTTRRFVPLFGSDNMAGGGGNDGDPGFDGKNWCEPQRFNPPLCLFFSNPFLPCPPERVLVARLGDFATVICTQIY